jgi:hypothetical protein
MHTQHHQSASARDVGALHAAGLEDNEQIRRTFGATPIYILRQSYGYGFAPGMPGDLTLGQALDHIDSASLSLLARRLAHRSADELNRM